MTYIPPNPNGQATATNSSPVVLASDQSTVPVSMAQLPATAAAADGTTNPTVSAIGTFPNIYNGATWERMRGDLGDGSPATGLLVNNGLLYNGTTYDRARGDTTNGAWVNVKTSVLPTGAALDATLTGGTARTKITDGTNNAAVKAASTAAAATDPSVVVNISPNSPAHPITVSSGTVTAVTAITNALPAGTNLMGKVGIDQTTVGTTNAISLAQLGTTTIATGNGVSSAGVQRVALVSDQTTNTNPLYTKQQAQTAGGATPFQLISAASTNATSVKASAGTVYGVQAYNNSATVAFLKLYNKASAPTVGTDTPVKTIMIPANGGAVLPITDIGVAFGTGIALAVTGLATVADTTAVALSQCQIGIDYA